MQLKKQSGSGRAKRDLSTGDSQKTKPVVASNKKLISETPIADLVQPTRCQIVVWPVERFRPYLGNPRKNDEAIDRMTASIREFGFKIPMLALSDGVLVDGHLRLKAARKLGLTELPVILCDEWTEAQVQAFRLLVNRSASWATWDEELLAVEFERLQAVDFRMELTGFELSEVETCLGRRSLGGAALIEEDAVPEPPVQPVTQLGDVWILGPHRVSCGDATEKEAVDRLVKNEKADLVFIDPPYNVNYEGRGSGTESRLRRQNLKRRQATKQPRAMLNDNLSEARFLEFCQGLFLSLRRAVKDGASAYVCCSDKAMPQFRQAFEGAGFHWSCTLIWAKDQFALSRADYHPQHEPVLFGWAEGQRHHWGGGRNQGTVWNIAKPRKNELHPTQKPVELVERALENSSEAAGLVLDLCAGSGSTLIACEKTGRRGRLMELDPKYVDVIVERWQDYRGEAAVLEADGRTFEAVRASERLAAAA